MKLIYDINDKPPLRLNLIYAFQQVMAIVTATMLVPVLVNSESGHTFLNQGAALCGAGLGTLFYLLATRRKSPVFLGSSFSFVSPLVGACACGYLGIFLGAVFAGLVGLIVALIVKLVGYRWVDKLLPPVVIGPTVALIGLTLSGNAIDNLTNFTDGPVSLIHIALGVFSFLVTVWASVNRRKWLRMVPFIVSILFGYILSLLLTLIGKAAGCECLQIVNLDAFQSVTGLFKVPEFTFLGIFRGDGPTVKSFSDVINIFMLFAPVAFVSLSEHIADHKNLSSIVNRDLIADPGLHRTLIGDSMGSIIGSFFGGCPNTTYGESVGCVAITGNASVSTIFIAAIYCVILSFFEPFMALVNSIPLCVIGGVCIALYGFIAVSGLKMIQKVNLDENSNLFVVAAVLVSGIGGLTLHFGPITISSIATALILGIVVNTVFNRQKGKG